MTATTTRVVVKRIQNGYISQSKFLHIAFKISIVLKKKRIILLKIKIIKEQNQKEQLGGFRIKRTTTFPCFCSHCPKRTHRNTLTVQTEIEREVEMVLYNKSVSTLMLLLSLSIIAAASDGKASPVEDGTLLFTHTISSTFLVLLDCLLGFSRSVNGVDGSMNSFFCSLCFKN